MFTIETERLRLRTFKPDDIAVYHATIYGVPEVMTYLPGGVPRPIEVVNKRMGDFIEYQQEHGFSIWAVEEKESNRFVGHGGLIHTHRSDDPNASDVEIAYAFGKDFWGKGYATEVAQACLDHGFRTIGLPRLIAVAYPPNLPSQRVMQKIGMTHRGITNIYHDEDLVLYDMARDDYLAAHSH